MRIEISHVADRGDLQKERLVMKVVADTDIGEYVILQTKISNNETTIKTYHSYWFPYKPVKKGDLVVLYTRSGKNGNETELNEEKTVHFFYWFREKPIWDKDDRGSVILHAPLWNFEKLIED